MSSFKARAALSALAGVEWRRVWGAQLEQGLARAPLQSRGSDRWLMRWALVCSIIGLSLYLACGYHAGFTHMNAVASAYPSWLWACLTALGDERVAFALTLFFAFRRPRILWTLILAALIAFVYSQGGKELFAAMRPAAVLPADSFNIIGPVLKQHSFPSGHGVTAAVFFGVLIYHTRWIELRFLWLLLAICVGLSRIAVGAHWPVDVAFGLMGGALCAWLGGWVSTFWVGPASKVTVHLIFVVAATVAAISLMVDDHGYREAAWMLRIIGITAVASAVWQYILLPLRRAG